MAYHRHDLRGDRQQRGDDVRQRWQQAGHELADERHERAERVHERFDDRRDERCQRLEYVAEHWDELRDRSGDHRHDLFEHVLQAFAERIECRLHSRDRVLEQVERAGDLRAEGVAQFRHRGDERAQRCDDDADGSAQRAQRAGQSAEHPAEQRNLGQQWCDAACSEGHECSYQRGDGALHGFEYLAEPVEYAADGVDRVLERFRQERHQIREQARDGFDDALGDDLHAGQDVLQRSADGVGELLAESAHVGVLVAQSGEPVLPCGLHRVHGPLDGGRRLLGGRAADAEALLHSADGLGHVGERIDGKVVAFLHHARQLVRVGDEPLHFRLGAAVAELEVVQHRVIAASKRLIRLLDGLDVGAHLVGVVRHVDDGLIAHLCGLGGVPAKRTDQRGREARDLVHIVVRADAGRLVRFGRVLLHSAGSALEQGVDAADRLLPRGIRAQRLLAGGHQRAADGCHTCSDGGDRSRGEALDMGDRVLGEVFERVACAGGEVAERAADCPGGGLCSGWEFGPYGSGGGGDVAEVVLGYVGYRCEFLPYFSCGISDGGADFAAE